MQASRCSSSSSPSQGIWPTASASSPTPRSPTTSSPPSPGSSARWGRWSRTASSLCSSGSTPRIAPPRPPRLEGPGVDGSLVGLEDRVPPSAFRLDVRLCAWFKEGCSVYCGCWCLLASMTLRVRAFRVCSSFLEALRSPPGVIRAHRHLRVSGGVHLVVIASFVGVRIRNCRLHRAPSIVCRYSTIHVEVNISLHAGLAFGIAVIGGTCGERLQASVGSIRPFPCHASRGVLLTTAVVTFQARGSFQGMGWPTQGVMLFSPARART